MKSKLKKALVLLLACVMTGCTDDTSKQNRDSVDNLSYVMPVIEINTNNTEGNVLDFATKPVARHVAKMIASWTPGYKMPPIPYYEDCSVTVTDKDKKVLIDKAEAQVKVRGNWTTTYDKKPFRIKFSEKQNLLGLNDGAEMKNWLLLAEYKDGSMQRNKTASEIANEILGKDNLYATDAEFVEVFINGEYWGVYLLAEQQQVNKNRVDITEVEKDYKGTDIGYFFEFDGYFNNEDSFHRFHISYADNAPLTPYDGFNGFGKKIRVLPGTDSGVEKDVGFTIKSDIYSMEQRDFIENFVEGAYRIMYESAYNNKAYEFTGDYSQLVESDLTPREAVEKVVDVNSLVDMYIISEIACDADLYWSSFYMSADFGENGNKKLTFTAPWDYDSAFGNTARCTDAKGYYASNIIHDVNAVYNTANPWLLVLAYEDWYRDIIKEKWTEAYDGGLFERVLKQIENDKNAYAKAFDRNYKKWDNIKNNSAFAGELSDKSKECKNQKDHSDYLYWWLSERVEFLNAQWHK